MRVTSACLGLALFALSAGCVGSSTAAQKMDEQIREGTDMGLDNMVKARDQSVESQISTGIAMDPGLANVKDKIEVVASHNVVTVTGRVKTESQLATIEEIVKNAVATANVKDYELDIEIDPSIEELPFEW